MLRTNKQFKPNFITEHYVKQIMNRSNWSALAKFRFGVASMRIETWRFERSVTSIASSKQWQLQHYMYEPLKYGSVINTDSMVL